MGEAFSIICDWIEDNQTLGPFVLGLIFVVMTPLMVPGLLMNMGTGYIFQVVYQTRWKAVIYGAITVNIGASLGSLISFLVGRYILGDFSARLFAKYKVLSALDSLFLRQGFKFCFLLRLCPLIPFNAFNYVMGGTSIAFSDYAFSAVGMLPICVAGVFTGSTLSDIQELISGDYS